MTTRSEYLRLADDTIHRATNQRIQFDERLTQASKDGDIEDRFTELNILQQSVDQTLYLANTYARLAQAASDPTEQTEQGNVPPPVTEEPLEEDHGMPFDQFMGNPIDVIDHAIGLVRAFSPRPVKDSPQA